MELFKKGYKVLSSKKNVLLKLKMGFHVTLSDIDSKPISKRLKKTLSRRG